MGRRAADTTSTWYIGGSTATDTTGYYSWDAAPFVQVTPNTGGAYVAGNIAKDQMFEIRWLMPKYQENDYYQYNFRVNRGDTVYAASIASVATGAASNCDWAISTTAAAAEGTTFTCGGNSWQSSGNTVVDDGAISLGGITAAIALGAAALAF